MTRSFVLVLASLVPAAQAYAQCVPDAGGVVINEFLVDPDGADSTVLLEWVELYNAGSSAADVSGWQLLKATQADAYGTEATFAPGTVIQPGGYLLIGEANVSGADVVVDGTMALGSGSNGDGVRLRDCASNIVDTVVYGDADNSQAVVDDSGAAATSVAPKPGRDQAVARRQNGVDTDASGNDFWVPTSNTPGGPNPAPPVCQGTTGALVINEFVANPAGADATALEEFVELYNNGGTSVSLEGWAIETSTSGSWSNRVTFGPSASVSPNGWFSVGETNAPSQDVTVASLALGSGSHGDGVRLVDCNGTVVDTVVYGDDNTDGILDDRGATDSFAGKPGDDESIARIVDGDDTNRSADDFFLTDEQTPGARNPSAPLCVSNPGNVVINEFLANPAGADGDVLLEWVELYNGGSSEVLLDDWWIGAATQANSFSEKHTFAPGTTIPADGHLLLGEANVSGADAIVAGTLGLGSGLRADGVRLYDCTDAVVDTVVFGDPSNEDLVVDDSGSAATSVAPTPGDDVALARRRDGQDSNRSGDDFVASSSPTPGASNPVFECFPSTGDVLLNEVLPDPEGSDGDVGLEWVELYNRSGDTLRVDGWQLIFASSGDDRAADVLLPPEASVPPLGFTVVAATPNVAEGDIFVPMSIGNGSGGDAVLLIDCEGTVVDIVVYGDDNEDGHLDESGNPAVSAGSPGSNQSIARAEDGADTDSAEDWVVDGTPSPGASNVNVVDTSDTGGDDTRGCNRNSSAPDGDAPGGCGSGSAPSADTGGCTTVPLPFGGLELGVLLFALARRRR